MINHFSLGVGSLQRSVSFYDAIFETLGYTRNLLNDKEVAYGSPGNLSFWLYPVDANDLKPMPGLHVAFTAPDQNSVKACYEAALRSGGRELKAPGPRPEISADYFGAMMFDPDGHKLEIVVG